MERTKSPKSKPFTPKIDKRTQVLALEALGSESFLSVNKKLLAQFGPEIAIYICNLVDKYKYFDQHGELGKDSSFFLTHEDQCAQTGMSEYQLRKCKKKLKKLDILYTEMRGLPPKEFYILNMEQLVQKFLRNIPLKTKGMSLKKLKECPFKNLRNIKDNKYKENKYKENKDPSSISGENSNQEESKRSNSPIQSDRSNSPIQSDRSNSPIQPIQSESDASSIENKITPSMFDEFWKLYPRKVDKGNAKTKWEKICNKPTKDRPSWRMIKSAIIKQKKTTRWQDPKFIPHPTTWLNNQRWLDDPAEMKGGYSPPEQKAERSSATDKGPSPQNLIKNYFPNDILRKAFYCTCYKPALDLFLNNSPNPKLTKTLIAETLIHLETQIEQEQNKKLSQDLRGLMPGPIDLVANYILWIEEQDWVTDPRMNALDISHGLFTRFRRDEATKDNMERDPLTGRSFLRG